MREIYDRLLHHRSVNMSPLARTIMQYAVGRVRRRCTQHALVTIKEATRKLYGRMHLSTDDLVTLCDDAMQEARIRLCEYREPEYPEDAYSIYDHIESYEVQCGGIYIHFNPEVAKEIAEC